MWYIIKKDTCIPLMPGYTTLTAAEAAKYNLIELIVNTSAKKYEDISPSLEVVMLTEAEAMRRLSRV